MAIPERRKNELLDWLRKERNPLSVGLWTAVSVLVVVLGTLFILFAGEMDFLGFLSVSMVISLTSGLAGGLVGLIARFIYGCKAGLLINGIVAVIVAVLTLWIVYFWALAPPSF